MHATVDAASIDIAIVGAGAAGLATAIFTRSPEPLTLRASARRRRRPGAKILVSGGSRCNVTNVAVTERNSPAANPPSCAACFVRFHPLKRLPGSASIGVPLHEEADGKLFPDSNRSRDVLDALLREGMRRVSISGAGARVQR